ncbi:MAG: hypothetical protein IMF18_10990 [Proteobacteria bacterium]|nr:hypothetical protein [Pseudomonadota bacterium]
MAKKPPSADAPMAEQDLALEELVAAESPAVENGSSADDADAEQALALEELVSAQTPATGESEIQEPPSAGAPMAEQDLALEELVGVETVEADKPAAEKGASVDDAEEEKALALEELTQVETQALGESETQEPSAVDAPEAEEVIALEELVAPETPPAEKPVAKKARAKEVATDLGVGLSDGEKDDLEKLITGLKQEKSVSAPGAALKDIQKQVKSMSKQLAQLGKMVLRYDSKMKACYEIMRLYHRKSEIMNERIDTIVESIKGGKKH